MAKKLRRFERAKTNLRYRFMKQRQPAVLLTPLHFRRRTKLISVSAGEKER
jgi:hypothetical protein